MNHIKTVFENIDRIIDSNNKIELCLLALTSVLEPLFKMPSYSNDVADIVRILLKNSYARLRYAALDIISFGLGTVLIADELLLEAAKVLSDKDFNYLKSKKLTTTFSSELYKISRSMTEEEYLFMRNMKLSKATSGIPNF
jgi:ribosomal protein L1